MNLKENYISANCCDPQPTDPITGYFSHDGVIKVHRADCSNLSKADPSRLIMLAWPDIIGDAEYSPDEDYDLLDDIDFRLLEHHRRYGFDYSNKVAAMLNLDRREVHDGHTKLRELTLLKRVEPKMIQYRKNIVPGKWIKHRNHTYYDLTEKGSAYLDYYLKQK
ncbi:MAG: DUF2250 domain-containing protein [FCB group bacterium]|nr:DUF2250 domain-containing protein [FCB group bacterium]